MYPVADIAVKPHILASAIFSTLFKACLLLKTARIVNSGIPIIIFHIVNGPGDVDTCTTPASATLATPISSCVFSFVPFIAIHWV